MSLSESRRQELIALAVLVVLIALGAVALTVKPRPSIAPDPKIGEDIVRLSRARGSLTMGAVLGADWKEAVLLVPGEDWHAEEKSRKTWFPRGVFAKELAEGKESAVIVFLDAENRPRTWTTVPLASIDLAATRQRSFLHAGAKGS
jgi:hypothetical protein